MRVLLFGGKGQVGWELQRALSPIGLVFSPVRGDRSGLCGDLTNFAAISETIDAIRPHVIFNSAAYTNVDEAERDPDIAFLLNERAPFHIAQEAKRIGAFFVHYSTDYVFDGSRRRRWSEDDDPYPINIYGHSKRAGEIAVLKSGVTGLIIRTSWIYSSRRKNFLKTILNLARRKEILEVVSDQIGSPTSAEFIADASIFMTMKRMSSLSKENHGCEIYHLCAQGETSWHEYAQFVVDHAIHYGIQLKTRVENIIPVSTQGYVQKASRPLFSALSCERASKDFSIHIPDWTFGVERVLSELSEQYNDQ